MGKLSALGIIEYIDLNLAHAARELIAQRSMVVVKPAQRLGMIHLQIFSFARRKSRVITIVRADYLDLVHVDDLVLCCLRSLLGRYLSDLRPSTATHATNCIALLSIVFCLMYQVKSRKSEANRFTSGFAAPVAEAGAESHILHLSQHRRLENQLQCKLKLPRRVGGGDDAKASAVRDIRIGRLVVGLVENIESLRTEIQPGCFAPQIESLVKTDICLEERIRPETVSRHVAVCRSVAIQRIGRIVVAKYATVIGAGAGKVGKACALQFDTRGLWKYQWRSGDVLRAQRNQVGGEQRTDSALCRSGRQLPTVSCSKRLTNCN